jgi:hypothetical protein
MDWTGNIGNIPLVIIGAICRDDGNPFGLDPETCNSDGVAYISFGQWVCLPTTHVKGLEINPTIPCIWSIEQNVTCMYGDFLSLCHM